jgi:hypothetical protein
MPSLDVLKWRWESCLIYFLIGRVFWAGDFFLLALCILYRGISVGSSYLSPPLSCLLMQGKEQIRKWRRCSTQIFGHFRMRTINMRCYGMIQGAQGQQSRDTVPLKLQFYLMFSDWQTFFPIGDVVFALIIWSQPVGLLRTLVSIVYKVWWLLLLWPKPSKALLC